MRLCNYSVRRISGNVNMQMIFNNIYYVKRGRVVIKNLVVKITNINSHLSSSNNSDLSYNLQIFADAIIKNLIT